MAYHISIHLTTKGFMNAYVTVNPISDSNKLEEDWCFTKIKFFRFFKEKKGTDN